MPSVPLHVPSHLTAPAAARPYLGHGDTCLSTYPRWRHLFEEQFPTGGPKDPARHGARPRVNQDRAPGPPGASAL